MDFILGKYRELLAPHGIRIIASGCEVVDESNARYRWCLVTGRPHRREIGDLIVREATFRKSFGNSPLLLISGTSDRPFSAYLQANGIKWLQFDELNSLECSPTVAYSPELQGTRFDLIGEAHEQADVLLLGRVIREKEIEDFLALNPEEMARFIEPGMRLFPAGQQRAIPQGILDLFCADAAGKPSVIECKRGPIHRSHVGQVCEYYQHFSSTGQKPRLLLAVNAASGAIARALATMGIEVKVIPLDQLVAAMLANGAVQRTVVGRPSSRHRERTPSQSQVTQWKREFADGLRDIFRSNVFDMLIVNLSYDHPKKLRVSRAQDGATVLYVFSNRSWLELGLPIVHGLLRRGVPLRVKTTGEPVYFSKGGAVPSIALDIHGDEALQWIRKFSNEFEAAILDFEEGLSDRVKIALLRHLGAVTQSHNPLKAKADGVCRSEKGCPYCATDRRIDPLSEGRPS